LEFVTVGLLYSEGNLFLDILMMKKEWKKDAGLIIPLFSIGLLMRLLISPYTSHGYDINIHRVWLFRLLKEGLFFYISSEGIELFGEYWGHDPDFCELPPIFPLTLFIMGKVYSLIRLQLDDIYLLVMFMKIPQIIAECSISLLIYFLVKRERSSNMGAFAALIFLLTPFTFLLTAVWGAPESIVSLFVTASMYMIYKENYLLASCLLGASLMVKPYTIVFLPIIILFSYPHIGARKTFLQFMLFVLSAFFVASPWLIVQREVFIDAMWSGALHNLGVRIPKGVIWGFPSFWLIVDIICSITGFPYEIIAPFQLYVFIFLAFVIYFMTVKLRLNLKKENLWFVSHLFLFCFMMFFPSAHEKWEYSCFPLLLVASFLIRKRSPFLFLTYFVLAFSLSGAVYGDGKYFFESADVLPMPRSFIYGGVLAEKWYYFLKETVKIMGVVFSQALSAFLFLGIFLLHLSILCNLSEFKDLMRKTSREKFSRLHQIQLDSFLKSSVKNEKADALTSLEQNISREVEETTNAFNLLLNALQDIFLKINEVEKMLRSGEINEKVYYLLMGSLAKESLIKINNIYALRDRLELIRARAKAEWAKEKMEISTFLSSENQRILEWDTHLKKSFYRSLNVWENIVSLVEKSLSYLTIERELLIIEQYLSLIKKHVSLPTEIIEECQKICEQRLNAILKNWSVSRRNIIEEISNIEEKISQMREKIREIEIRFAVGEFTKEAFEHMLSNLQLSLKSMEEDSLKMKKYLQEIDEKCLKVSRMWKETIHFN